MQNSGSVSFVGYPFVECLSPNRTAEGQLCLEHKRVSCWDVNHAVLSSIQKDVQRDDRVLKSSYPK